jgi:hypothetical protein
MYSTFLNCFSELFPCLSEELFFFGTWHEVELTAPDNLQLSKLNVSYLGCTPFIPSPNPSINKPRTNEIIYPALTSFFLINLLAR